MVGMHRADGDDTNHIAPGNDRRRERCFSAPLYSGLDRQRMVLVVIGYDHFPLLERQCRDIALVRQ